MAKKKKNNYFTTMLKICRQQWSRNNAERKACFLKARVDNKSTSKIMKWSCNVCEGHFALSEIDCDHIIPIANTVPQDMIQFLECFRLLHAPLEKLQILCKSCHKIKTKEEAATRARMEMHSVILKNFSKIEILSSITNELSDKNLKKLITILKKDNNEKALDKFIKTFG